MFSRCFKLLKIQLHYEFSFFFLIEKKDLQPIFLTECPAMILNKIEKNQQDLYRIREVNSEISNLFFSKS